MYRLANGDDASNFTDHSFFFREEPGYLWKKNTIASCLLNADLNNDGLDDILICNERSESLMFLQNNNSSWSALPTPGPNTINWRNARVADVTGDGIPDIVVVGRGQPSYLKVFQGFSSYPHYNFDITPYFEMTLPFAAPDLEILDVNDDGRPDLYVVQVDETPTRTNYCSHVSRTLDFFGEAGPRAPDSFTPPLDLAKDRLLTGSEEEKFIIRTMDFALPGCGNKVERFGGGKTMILAQGSEDRSGHNLLLQW
jgi:FG-GAP-like repeat